MSMPFADDRLRMLMPTTNRPWPPPEMNPVTYQWRQWSAWWTGEPDLLQWTYYNLGANSPVGRAFFAPPADPETGPVPRRPARQHLLHLLGEPDPAG